MKHWKIQVVGKVQGVYFRASTKAVADQLGVKGWVCNMPDGSVYIEAEGDDFAMESFLDWCQEGPDEALVEEVKIEESASKGFHNFEILKKQK